MIVNGREDESSERREEGVDVTRACGVLSALKSRTKLTLGRCVRKRPSHRYDESYLGVQQVDIVASYISLGHSDNRGLQGALSVVVRCHLRDEARQLGDADFANQVSLKACKEDLSLTGLETI